MDMSASISETAAPACDLLEAFELTAPVYDVLTVHHDYEGWTRMIESLARRHGLADRGRMLDVGCGTGKSFLPWVARGWEVVGCDSSPAMLERAREKAPPEVELLVADARELEVLGAFELVLVLDDVVNYNAREDHEALFAALAANLAPDGLLVFDLNTLHAFRSFFAEPDVREVDGCVAVWRGQASPAFRPGDAADAVLDAFVRDEDGAWHHTRAHHREYHHPLDEIERSLAGAGLELVAAYGQDAQCNVEPGIDELRHSKGMVIARRAPAPRYSLRETVEAFPSGDGSIYFLRGGPRAEQVIEKPTAADRALLELLHAPHTLDQLRAAVPGEPVEALLADLRGLGLVREDSGRPLPLPAEALARYDRQLPYFATATGGDEAAAAAQRRLLDASVCVVGCGGLGSWTAAALVCAGVGRLVLVDDDTVALSNLNRQLLFRHSDLGRLKVDAAAEALRAFDPALEVETHRRRVACVADVVAIAGGSDLVVATADSPPYAIARWINAAALELGIPHVSAAQFPPFVRVGPLFVPGVTGCEHCQEIAARREFPDYEALVSYRERDPRTAATLGPLSALVGSVLATDVMHLLSGVATPATQGHAIVIDARDLSVTKEPVPREPDCPVCATAVASA
jgi:bacteriocin biosynthesis cyclodehydratase domain-containing protein